MIARTLTLHGFLNDLRAANIAHDLAQHRDEAVMVIVSVPGERWEVEFFEDAAVEVEVFRSDGTIRDASALAELFAKHSG